jgi:iron-sulfur cluster assembly protein
MFSLTSAAAQQIRKAAQDSGAQDMALRVAARQSADGSIDYGMGFDESSDDDVRIEIEGVAVLIAEHHQAYLEDTLLDFVELEPGDFNFIFIDQSASAASGCATGGERSVGGGGGCGGCGGGNGGCGNGGCGSSKGSAH